MIYTILYKKYIVVSLHYDSEIVENFLTLKNQKETIF